MSDYGYFGGGVPAARSAAIERINWIITRAERSLRDNIRTRGVMASPPTVTVGTTAPTSPFAQYDVTTGKVAVLGGWMATNTSFIYAPSATRIIGAATGSGSNAFVSTSRVAFHTDAPLFTYRLSQSTGLTAQRIIIDWEYVSLTGTTLPAINTVYYVTLDLTSVGGRKPRRVEIELNGGPATSGGSNSTPQMGYLYFTPGDSFWLPSSAEIGPQIGIFGDSYTFGPAAGQVTTTMLSDGWARILGDYLDCPNTWCSGVNGAGWIARATNNSVPNMLDRVTDITAWPHDLVIIAMGINDLILAGTTVDGVVINATNLQARVTEVLQAIRAAKPLLPVVVLGPFTRPNTLSSAASYETAIAAGVAAMNDNFIKFAPTISEKWQTGTTGSVSSPTGAGNADHYISSDGTHMTLTGHANMAGRAAAAVLAALKAMT